MSKLPQGTASLIAAAGFIGIGIFSPEVLATGGTGSGGISSIAESVTQNLPSLAKLVTAVSYFMGGLFGLLGLVKFYGYSTNPQQVQGGLKVPIVLLLLAGALVYLPSVITTSGKTIFGSGGGNSQTITGTENFVDK